MSSNNILLVNIGNTSVCTAIGRGKIVSNSIRMQTSGCTPVSVKRQILRVVRKRSITDAVICSVVPRLNALWSREIQKALGRRPLLVGHKLKTGITLDYSKPATLGADRLANVCGAGWLYGAPVIVVDIGTAITFDVVTRDGRFIGGAIAPGPAMMADYMAERTTLLPSIRIDGKCPKIGRNTVEAMQVGALAGCRGMIREIIGYLCTQNKLSRFKLVATGGWAGMICKGMNMPFIIDQEVTLQGMNRIYELNKKDDGGRHDQ